MNARTLPLLSLQDYLDWENRQVERHEFYRGEIFAMVGALRVHGTVISNLAGELRNQLKGSACRVFHEGMKLQIGDDTLLYPDVFVTCDRNDLATKLIFTAPTLVAEVLSPSNQGYDRSQKFAFYRRIPTLQEYLLLDPATWRVEAFRRNAHDQWVLHDMSGAQWLDVHCLDLRVAMADIFDGVEPPTAEALAPPVEADD